MESFSQTHQDLFALYMNRKKTNGTFLEIGANHPISNNNTYLLESNYQWKGLMIEYDPYFEPLYKLDRPLSFYQIQDATKVDYKGLLEKHSFPTHIDYLQIDLDVDNKSTLDTLVLLDNTVFDHYTFATVTFEHDIYRGDYFHTRNLSREIFKKRGYELVFPDVLVYWEGGYKPFEDWYAHPDLIDIRTIRLCKTHQSLKSQDIIDRIQDLRL
jgi:hypothetical protein